MSFTSRLTGLAISVIFILASSNALAVPPVKCDPWPQCKDDSGGGGGGTPTGFSVIGSRDWGETPVRKILQAFAYGGMASDAQIAIWASMSPEAAVSQMLTFNPVNVQLSPPGDGIDASNCSSLESLQNFWSSDDPQNIMKYADRYRYATLNTSGNLNTGNLQRTWTKAISTRGCNQFLHKMGLYLTNYHASISVHKTRAGLIRAYYDDVVAELIGSGNFVNVATVAASHPAVARAYGHQYSRYYNGSDRFSGTDDFGREFHQLVFRIQGTTEDEAYHEDVTIEHTAWLLSGMEIDKVFLAYGSNNFNTGDWYVPMIQYSNHYDMYEYFSEDPPINTSDRYLRNFTYHYDSGSGAGSCLEILSEFICGANSGEKIAALAPVAASHPESMENVPVYMIDFFECHRC
jgi:hypothetical protein